MVKTVKIKSLALLSILLLVTSGKCIADDKSDCLNGCTNEKRNSDMFCPPDGGSFTEDHKECLEKNNLTYKDCTNNCSPPSSIVDQPLTTTTPSPKTEDQPTITPPPSEPGETYKKE